MRDPAPFALRFLRAAFLFLLAFCWQLAPLPADLPKPLCLPLLAVAYALGDRPRAACLRAGALGLVWALAAGLFPAPPVLALAAWGLLCGVLGRRYRFSAFSFTALAAAVAFSLLFVVQYQCGGGLFRLLPHWYATLAAAPFFGWAAGRRPQPP